MYKRILVPVDGSHTSGEAFAAALQMARESGGCVRAVHLLDEVEYVSGYGWAPDVLRAARMQAGCILDEALQAGRGSGVAVDSGLLDEPSQSLGQAVAAEALRWGADLIVLGSHGRRGVARALLGSGAEQVLRLAPVPVLVVRGHRQPPAHSPE